MSTNMEFTRINNDVNGNPRYVVHFFALLSDKEQDEIRAKAKPFEAITDMYNFAVSKANKIGGKRYRGKDFGGGIVFQSYNITNLEKSINELNK